jgi:hypothetical protein
MTPEGRWRVYAYDELIARENGFSVKANLGTAEVKARRAGRNYKASLDIFWLKDDSLADSDNLPPPEVIAQDNTPPRGLLRRRLTSLARLSVAAGVTSSKTRRRRWSSFG